jgi:hypothetical protein
VSTPCRIVLNLDTLSNTLAAPGQSAPGKLPAMMTRRNANKVASAHRCSRCGGSGHMSGYQHVQGGVCFRCDGLGIDPAHAATVKAERLHAAELLRAADARDAAEQAEFLACADRHYVAPADGCDFLALLVAADASTDAAAAELGRRG